MYRYIMTVLGNMNRVEHCSLLTFAGLTAVSFGVVIAIGLTLASGLFYSTVHGSLPFLALGETYA